MLSLLCEEVRLFITASGVSAPEFQMLISADQNIPKEVRGPLNIRTVTPLSQILNVFFLFILNFRVEQLLAEYKSVDLKNLLEKEWV